MWLGNEGNGLDILAAGGWLAATGGLLWSSNRLSRWFFPQERWDARLLQILLFSWAQIVLLAVGLGLGGQLYPMGLLAGALVLSGVCYWLTSSLPDCSAEELTEDDSRSYWGERLRQGIWALALAFLLARVIEGEFWRFPSDWDTLTYHLLLVVQWLQRHSLYAPDEGNWANPGNNELIGLWCVAPFSGDFLISLTICRRLSCWRWPWRSWEGS